MSVTSDTGRNAARLDGVDPDVLGAVYAAGDRVNERLDRLGRGGEPGHCLLTAAMACFEIRRAGYFAVIQCGAGYWRRTPDPREEYPMFGYAYAPDTPRSVQIMMTGGMPEYHAWVAVPGNREGVELKPADPQANGGGGWEAQYTGVMADYSARWFPRQAALVGKAWDGYRPGYPEVIPCGGVAHPYYYYRPHIEACRFAALCVRLFACKLLRQGYPAEVEDLFAVCGGRASVPGLRRAAGHLLELPGGGPQAGGGANRPPTPAGQHGGGGQLLMILHAFRPDQLAAALRWSAAGGLALHLRPGAGTRLTSWEPGTRYGPDRADLYGCDPEPLRLAAASVWIVRAAMRDAGLPNQRVPVAGKPLHRLLARCGGCVAGCPWYDADHALGLLWGGLARKRPVRTSLAEITEPGRGWVGPTPGWGSWRHGWAWYAVLPGGTVEHADGVIGRDALWGVSVAASVSQSLEPVVRQLLPGPTPGSPRVLTAVAARVQHTLYRLLGVAVRGGVGLTGREHPWVTRVPQPAQGWNGYALHLRRWGMTPGPSDFRRAGYVC